MSWLYHEATVSLSALAASNVALPGGQMHPGVDLRCFWEVYERWLRVIGFVFGRWESQQLELRAVWTLGVIRKF